MSVAHISLGFLRTEIDGRVLYPEATLIVSGDVPLQEPVQYPPPKRPNKPRPAPNRSDAVAAFNRTIGYGR